MRATGAIISQGNRTALLEARLIDENGKLYAYATSTCMILKSG
jgi:acyl-coenzyme A thioesterase PaaI-like protein